MNDYRYTVDGDKVTMAEIYARCPQIQQQLVRRRIAGGVRTWAGLGATPVRGNAAQKAESKRRLNAALARCLL